MAKKLTLPFTATGWVAVETNGACVLQGFTRAVTQCLPEIYRTRAIAIEDVSLWDDPPKPVRIRITIEEFHK